MTSDSVVDLRRAVREKKPLVHCLIHHISSNDCANALLAAGARAIMAEYPREVAAVTAQADALALNLGNISDARMKAMLLAAQTAKERGLPSTVDVAGTAVSPVRLGFADKLAAVCRPWVLRGNITEMIALESGTPLGGGVDARPEDAARPAAWRAELAGKLAARYGAVVLISGATDVAADGREAYLVRNGHALLGLVTGTGCMLNALIGSFLSVGGALAGVLAAAAFFSVCGEEAARTARGPGSFRAALLDEVYLLPDSILSAATHIERIC
jgi:hydroxyethylthiazole kinase